MSIFPSETISVDDTIQSTVTASTELPPLKEYAWDFVNNDFILVDGKNVIVTELEAVKVWVWKALQTQRYRYLAYSWNYGSELEDLVSQGLSTAALKSELERYLTESLLINPYITGIKNVVITVEGSKADVAFTAGTVYGEVNLSV